MIRSHYRSHRKIYLIVGWLILAAAVVWAGSELSGQANAKATEAAESSAEIESVSLDTLKPPKKEKAPNCDWQLEKKLRKEIKANDEGYQKLVGKAKGQVQSSGQVSEETKAEVLESAQAYNQLQTDYSEMWKSCNCKTRSKLAAKLAASRLKNAEVVVSEIDEAKLEEMEKAQAEVKAARREYAEQAQADDELSQEDKRDIQANVVPQTDKMLVKAQTLASSVTSLLKEVQGTASSASSGGLGGMLSAAKKLVGGGGPTLLTKVKMLVQVTKNLVSGVQDLQTDADLLSR